MSKTMISYRMCLIVNNVSLNHNRSLIQLHHFFIKTLLQSSTKTNSYPF